MSDHTLHTTTTNKAKLLDQERATIQSKEIILIEYFYV